MSVEEIQKKARVALLRGGFQRLQDCRGGALEEAASEEVSVLFAFPEDIAVDVAIAAEKELKDVSWMRKTLDLLIRYQVMQAALVEGRGQRFLVYFSTGRLKELLDRCAVGDDRTLAWFAVPETDAPPFVNWARHDGPFLLGEPITQSEMDSWLEKTRKHESPVAPLARTLDRLNAVMARRGRVR